MPRPVLRTAAAAIAMASVTMVACAQQATEDPLAGEWNTPFELDEADEAVDEIDDPISPETQAADEEAPTAGEVVEAALVDAERYWERTFPELYGDAWAPLQGGFWPYGPRSEQPPCGSPPPVYDDIASNAFYCPQADLIAWDATTLIPELYDRFGGFTLGIVFAHEMAHAVQARSGTLGGATIMTELQADCFAGAWTADVAAGGSEHFAVSDADLDRAVAGFLELRDTVGVDASDPAAHGTGFDRIGAFSEGYEQGPERCRDYPSLFDAGELVIVEVPFRSIEDFERGGNLPLAELWDLAHDDLEDFWNVIFTEMDETWAPVQNVVLGEPGDGAVECGDEAFSGDELRNASFYCADTDTIYLDAGELVPTLNEIGDYAVVTELARRFADAAQVRLGTTATTVETDLQADCYTGVYAASGFLANRGTEQLVLSPGDLDEAVIAFLLGSELEAEADGSSDPSTSAFDRFDAYRSGFLEGLEACAAY